MPTLPSLPILPYSGPRPVAEHSKVMTTKATSNSAKGDDVKQTLPFAVMNHPAYAVRLTTPDSWALDMFLEGNAKDKELRAAHQQAIKNGMLDAARNPYKPYEFNDSSIPKARP